MRKWSQLHNDEIFAIWKEYLRTEGFNTYNVLMIDNIVSKPMRLTMIEVLKLVDELLDRLEAKEIIDDQRKMDSKDAYEKGCTSRGNGCCER
jgi:hypothetical protein